MTPLLPALIVVERSEPAVAESEQAAITSREMLMVEEESEAEAWGVERRRAERIVKMDRTTVLMVVNLNT
jgi:hypothetical protein